MKQWELEAGSLIPGSESADPFRLKRRDADHLLSPSFHLPVFLLRDTNRRVNVSLKQNFSSRAIIEARVLVVDRECLLGPTKQHTQTNNLWSHLSLIDHTCDVVSCSTLISVVSLFERDFIRCVSYPLLVSSCLYLSIFVWHSDISCDRKSLNRPISLQACCMLPLYSEVHLCVDCQNFRTLFSLPFKCVMLTGRKRIREKDSNSPDNSSSRQYAWGQLLLLDTTEIQNDWSYFPQLSSSAGGRQEEKRTQIPLVETKKGKEKW